MKNITSVSEKRIKEMIKQKYKYAEVARYILDAVKCSAGCYGLTIAELKKLDLHINNEFQFYINYMPELVGLSILFPSLINVTLCGDLHYIKVFDFNKLIKDLAEMQMQS